MLADRSRWGAAALLTIVALTAGCGVDQQGAAPASADGGAAPASPTSGFVAGGPAVQFYAAAERTSPSPVTGELLDGGYFDLVSLRGKVVVINWWGSWCEPCRRETPHLMNAYNATKQVGVEFVGVDVRDSRDAATSFAADYQVTYPSIFDPAGTVALAFKEVPPTVVPTTVILDRSGRVAVAFRKVIGAGELEPIIRRIAAEPTPHGGR